MKEIPCGLKNRMENRSHEYTKCAFAAQSTLKVAQGVSILWINDGQVEKILFR